MRRGQSGAAPTLAWGLLQFNPETYEVNYGRSPIHLTPKEFALLRSGRRVLSRAALVERVWTLQEAPEMDTIKSYIKNLRAKLKAAGAAKDLIETVHGVGYQLKALE
ncbi:MAG: winged helix-turn-helix domain-containing protein [Cyanobacteria bacterium J06638_28]